MTHASPQVTPDATYLVLPEHYEPAITADTERWTPVGRARRGTVWAGRRVWRLLKGQQERSLWQLYAFAGERTTQEQERHELERLQHPAVDRYVAELAWQFVTSGRITHSDTLYARVARHLEQYAGSRSERAFWVERWLAVRTACLRVWDEHVENLQRAAAKDRLYGATGCAPDDGEPTADELLEEIAADNAHRVAVTRGGA